MWRAIWFAVLSILDRMAEAIWIGIVLIEDEQEDDFRDNDH